MHPRDHPRFRRNQSTPQAPYQQQQQNPPFLPYDPYVPPYRPRRRNRDIENLIVFFYSPYGLESNDSVDFRTASSPDSPYDQNGYIVIHSPGSAYRRGPLPSSYRNFSFDQGDPALGIGAFQREFDSVNHNGNLSSSGWNGLVPRGQLGFHNPARRRRHRSIASNFTLTRRELGEDLPGAERASPLRGPRHNHPNHPHSTIYYGDLPLEEEESPPMSNQAVKPVRTQKKDKIREGLAKGADGSSSSARQKHKKPSPVRGGLIPIGLLPYDHGEIVDNCHKPESEGSGSANQNISGDTNQQNEGDESGDNRNDRGNDKGNDDEADDDKEDDDDKENDDEGDDDKEDDKEDDKSKSKRKREQTSEERDDEDDHERKKVDKEEKAVRLGSKKYNNSSTKNQTIKSSDPEMERSKSKVNSKTKKEDEGDQRIILAQNQPPRFRIDVQNPENSNVEVRTVSSSELENFVQPRRDQLQDRNDAVPNSNEETRWVDSRSHEHLYYPEHRNVDRIMEQLQKQNEDEDANSNDLTEILPVQRGQNAAHRVNQIRNPTVTTVQNSQEFRAGIARQNRRRNQNQIQNEESSIFSSFDGEQQQIIPRNDNSSITMMNTQGQRLQALAQLGHLRGSHPVHSDSEDIRRRNYHQRTPFTIAEAREDHRDSRNSSNRRSYSSRDIPPPVMSEEQLDLSIGMEESRGSNPVRPEQERRDLRNRSEDEDHKKK